LCSCDLRLVETGVYGGTLCVEEFFPPLLSLYISLFHLYLFWRFVGCASGCLAFWVTGTISFSFGPILEPTGFPLG